MTLNEIASSIRNRVADGLSGNISNQAFSLQQLMDEIDLTRADFTHKYSFTSKLDPKYLIQEISALKVECRNLSKDCQIKAPGADVPSVKIPKIMPLFGDNGIEYIGLHNLQENFSIYYSPQDVNNHSVRIKTRHRPFAWVDVSPDPQGMNTIYFFNFGKNNPLKFVKIRGIFEHPSRVYADIPNGVDMEYAAPLHMQNAIIDTLTEKYVRYFRQLNVPATPNTQTDNIT